MLIQTAVLVAIILASVSEASPASKQLCIDKCTQEYSQKYKECRESAECKRFVERQGSVCVEACGK